MRHRDLEEIWRKQERAQMSDRERFWNDFLELVVGIFMLILFIGGPVLFFNLVS